MANKESTQVEILPNDMIGVKSFLLPLLLIGCALSGALTAQAQSNYEPYSFTTLAGLAPGSTDGAGSAARFNIPRGATVDSAGNIYVADSINNTIRKITSSGVVSTLAGLAGSSGSADGTGNLARFNRPSGVAVDSADNVYVADSINNTIRKITPSGVVSTLAGLPGSSGSADGTGSAARFNYPQGVAVDSAGNVYVADTNNDTIRKITSGGVVATLAGLAGSSGSADGTGGAARFATPFSVAVDSANNVYVADSGNHTIRKITPSGVVSTLAGLAGSSGSADGSGSAARFNSPEGVAVDSSSNVYVADFNNFTIRKVTSSGVVSTLAGLAGSSGSADGTGSVARFFGPAGVAVDSAGNVNVADTFNSTIRKITVNGAVSTLAGLASPGSADGTGSAARFYYPTGVAVDSAGNVYVADEDNDTIRKITSGGVVSTLAGLAGAQGSADGTGNAARFLFPNGVAVDSVGNVYVADTYNFTIRKITSGGVVSTLAGLAGAIGSADGTGSAARFNYPTGVAVDSAGNVYVGDTYNFTIRKITSGGVVSTLAGLAGAIGSTDGIGSAARFNHPRGVAVDSAGNVYIADTDNLTIRKITSGGVVSTLAGLAGAFGSTDGTGSAARFYFPFGVAVDSAGNVYVGDTYNVTIRKITSGGVVRTLAGLAGSYGSADGTGSAALFNNPFGVAVSSSGNLYVADWDNHAIRAGAPAPPVITSPLIASGTVGQQFVYQYGTSGATSVAVTNLPPGLTFNPVLRAIVGNPTAAGTFQVGLSASNAGGTTTATLNLTIQPIPHAGPTITSSSAVTGRPGQFFRFQVTTTGGTPAARISAIGLPAGLSIDAVTGLISGTTAFEGSTAVTLTVTDGAFTTSAILQMTFTADPALPVITSPNSAALTPGVFFSYTITAPTSVGASDPTIFTLVGTLPPGLSFDAATGTISGIYTGPLGTDLAGGTLLGSIQLFATNSHGTSTFEVQFRARPKGVVNIATRTTVGSGDNVLIGGFIVDGDVPKIVIIRAIGPSLNAFLSGALQDPTLELHDSAHADRVVFNDNWRDTQEQIILGSGLQPADNSESAIVVALDPGSYTAIVRGTNATTGIAVVEVFDLGTANAIGSSGSAKVSNIATRGFVNTGDNVMIGGLIIQGQPTRVIIRAIGPALTQFGVPDALANPQLELHDATSTIAQNDDWQTTQIGGIITSDQVTEIQNSQLAPTNARESAIIVTLPPGSYTAIVRGANNTTGNGLVEAYALP